MRWRSSVALSATKNKTANGPGESEKFGSDVDRRVDVGELIAESVEQIDVSSDEQQRRQTVAVTTVDAH